MKIPFISLRQNGLSGPANIVLAYRDLKCEPSRMLSSPLIVQIEPTVHCNLECTMCANPISGRKKRHMSLPEFKKIVDGMPFAAKMSLVGAGEPLLNPDLFGMLSYARSKGIIAGFATNGMLLDEKNCAKILASGAEWVNISIDSANSRRYEEIRKLANFDKVTSNIRRIMVMKGGKRIPEVSIWFVIMKENIDDLPGVIKLAKELGVKKVSAQMEHNWSNEKIKERMASKRSGEFYDRVKKLLIDAGKAARKEGVSFSYVNVPQPGSGRSCKWPWRSCYITAEGFVTPCCLQGSNPGIINFGNVFNDDFAVIWNNQAYQDFRKALSSRSMPSICADCTAYYGKLKL
jgi:radical SAM protein with 4Fe4S-binding SPASM domain